jgi:cytochrome c nitrite reductase small subunit
MVRVYGIRTTTALVILVGIAIGLLIGVEGFTFVYARGSSYLTNDPLG